jgi:Zn-dependent protease with chaperone function
VNEALTNLGSGVVLAWVALPLLALVAYRAEAADAASRHRACVWAVVLGAGLLVLPFARAGTDSGTAVEIPGWLEHLVGIARYPMFATRLGALSPVALAGLAWCAVVACLALRALVRSARLTGICRRAEAAPEDVVALVARHARALGVRTPRVLVSSDCSIPFTAGVLRPTIVLPRGLVDAFAPDALDLVILHELTHVLRGDVLGSLLVDGACVLLAGHPTARRLAADACLAREQAVDAYVAAGAPAAYARVLVDVAHHARFGERVARAVCMHGSDLARRIDAMADARPRRRASLAPVVGAALLVAGSALAAPRVDMSGCPFSRGHSRCPHAVGSVGAPLAECPHRSSKS